MPLDWQSTAKEDHESLDKRADAKRDPEWDALMAELERGSGAVRIPFADDKERGTLARSVGRRAAHRGFPVDIRYGEGFLSVRKAAEEREPAKRRRSSRSRESTEEGQ